MPRPWTYFPTLALLLAVALTGCAGSSQSPTARSKKSKTAAPSKTSETKSKPKWTKRTESMVEITSVCPSIFYELRYASRRNFTGRQIYPTNSRCLVRKSVAVRLKKAQEELRHHGYGLKIWDAYRPQWAHTELWASTPNPEFVASPDSGGSWHTWGAAVDVTLVDLNGREQKMPTDFDDFTSAAKSEYRGDDPKIGERVRILRTAMFNAGFRGLRDEWWHFTAEDAIQFSPVKMHLEKGGIQ